jgi:chromosome segregation ATPase
VTDADKRDLEADIRDLQVRIRLIRRKWRGASEMPEDQALVLGNLEAELRELRAQRSAMDEAQPLTLPPIRDRIESISRSIDLLTSRLPNVENRVQELERRTRRVEERLAEWFEADARGRRVGQLWATIYRVGLLTLIVVDIAVRALR